MVSGEGRRRWLPWLPSLWSLVLAVLLLGPALAPGYVLTYDMVWVPDLALRPDFWGLGSGLPRAVPSDAVVALLDEVFPGMLLQKLVLVGALVLLGTGTARLLPERLLVGRLAAATMAIWNPFVVERLVIGHWPLLLTAASLPWIVVASRRLEQGRAALPYVVLALALGSLSPVGGLVATGCAVLCVGVRPGRRLRRVVAAGGAGLLVNAPWIVAGIGHGGAALSDPAGVGVFAARGEGPLPLLPTLLGLGGTWNAEVVPASRTTWAAAVSLVVVLAVAAAGLRAWRRHTATSEQVALVGAALAGLLLASAGSVAPGLLEWVVARVPGGGLVRDGARFVVLLLPLLSVTFGWGVASVADRVRPRVVATAATTALLLAPLALLPDAALGVSGRVSAVDLPRELHDARAVLDERWAAGARGDVVLVPFTPYRRPSWNDGRPTLDPLGRLLRPDYLSSDVLVVSGRRLPGEDERAARVAGLLDERGDDPDALAAGLRDEGIRWVVLDREALTAIGDEAPGVTRLPGGRVVHDDDLLTIWELPGPVPSVDRGWRTAALASAWLAAAAAVVVAAAGVGRDVARRGRRMKTGG